jgi:hypothetical protein
MGRRYVDNSVIGAIVGLSLFVSWILFCFALIVFKMWLIGSLLTSGIKAAKDDCRKTYGIETVLSGNWFCPTK